MADTLFLYSPSNRPSSFLWKMYLSGNFKVTPVLFCKIDKVYCHQNSLLVDWCHLSFINFENKTLIKNVVVSCKKQTGDTYLKWKILISRDFKDKINDGDKRINIQCSFVKKKKARKEVDEPHFALMIQSQSMMKTVMIQFLTMMMKYSVTKETQLLR